jgi:zinc protease
MKKIFFSLVVCLCFSLGVEAKILDLNEFVLGNGLKVMVASNMKAPVVMHKLYYKVGAVNDPIFKGGIAHLLEHMMFRGTTAVKDKEFNRLTEIYGADNNAYTTFLHTGYYEFSDIAKLELMMALEADRMENLVIKEDLFVKERDVVLEERMQRFETEPTTKFFEQINKLFWEKHPFARPVSGEVEEIVSLEREDAVKFYDKYYNPSNAFLVMVGDINVDEAKFLAEKYYGKIKNKEIKSKLRTNKQLVLVDITRVLNIYQS